MPNNTTRAIKMLLGLGLGACLGAVAPAWGQEAIQATDAVVSENAETATPTTSQPSELAETVPPDPQAEPDAVLDYEALKTLSRDEPETFPVDI